MTEDNSDQLDPRVRSGVAKLANLLRRCGSRVLTNSCALSLSWPVYHQISTALSLFASHTSDQAKVLDCKLILDLEYLKSFLSRVPSLVVYHANNRECPGPLSLHQLQHLRHLDLKRLPLHLVTSLSSLQTSLISLRLDRCQVDIQHLLTTCLDSLPFPGTLWSSLSHLSLVHCGLTTLSHPGLATTPHLTHLDLSYNQLTDTQGVELLDNLSVLNLSFNRLNQLPTTHPSALLTSLSLAFNRVELLPPTMDHLPYLQLLDLAGNCLMHHDALAPISSLNKLLQLDLRSNPLSTHPLHRSLSSSWLHPSLCSSSSIILDLVPLSSAELALIGTSRILISPVISPSTTENATLDLDTTPTSPPFDLDDMPRSASWTGSVEGSLVSGYTVTTVGGSRRRRKKRKKARVAVISDEMDYSETTENEAVVEEVVDKKEVKEDTAVQLAELRAEYGEEDWLRAEAGSKLHSLLGLVEGERDTDSVIQNMLTRNSSQEGEVQSPEVTLEPPSDTEDKIAAVGGGETEVKDVTSSLEGVERVGDHRVSTVSNVSATDIYCGGMDRETSPVVDKGARVEVTRTIPGDDSGRVEELVLAVSEEFIREVDQLGQTRVKWFLHSLEQADMVGRKPGGRVSTHLLFNTVRRDRRERLYTMSESGYSTLMAICSPVLEAAATASASLPSLQCVKCQSVFSDQDRVGGRAKGATRCPNCGSTMVIESEASDDQEVVEGVALGIPACEALDLAAIADDSRRASTPREHSTGDSAPERSFLMPSVPFSPVKSSTTNHLTLVTADIHDHVVKSQESHLPDLLPRPEPKRSSEGSEDGSNSPSEGLRKGFQRSESSSDISVLSNPSEASIEVLPLTGEVTSAVGEEVVENQSHIPCYQDKLESTTEVDTMANSQADTLVNSQAGTLVNSQGEGKEEVTVDEEEVTYHSCLSHEDSGLTSGTEDGASTLLNLSQTLSLTDQSTLAHPPEYPQGVMDWNYMDFSVADHRVQLFCSISLFREEEDLLLLARGQVHLRSDKGSLWPGLLVVTNKRLYVLRITGVETEEPEDWLELRATANVLKLSRLVGLVGAQGVGLEVGDTTSPSSSLPAFYRLPPMVVVPHQQDSLTNSDCFYLVLGDTQRTNRLTDQLVDKLQETVRSTPIPVTWLTADEESLLTAQVERELNKQGEEEGETKVDLFQMTKRLEEESGVWVQASIIVTPSRFVVTRDFFQWIFQSTEKELGIEMVTRIEAIKGMAIYESWPERLSLQLDGETVVELQLQTEEGVQQLVASLRGAWEAARGIKLEEITRFHLSGSKQVVVMQSLLEDQAGSLASSNFDLGQWIKVTTSGLV